MTKKIATEAKELELSTEIVFALSALRDVCDEKTYAALETLAVSAPQIIMALTKLIELETAIDEIVKNKYERKLIITWMANMITEGLHFLGKPLLDEKTFNEKYGGNDAT